MYRIYACCGIAFLLPKMVFSETKTIIKPMHSLKIPQIEFQAWQGLGYKTVATEGFRI